MTANIEYIKEQRKDTCAESPGSFYPSFYSLKVKADRRTIERLQTKVLQTLYEEKYLDNDCVE